METTPAVGRLTLSRRALLGAGATTATAVAMGGLLAACGKATTTSSAGTSAGGKRRKLVFAFPTFLPFAAPINVGASDACKQAGWEYTKFFESQEYSAVNLVNSIQSAIQMQPDVIMTGGWEKGVTDAVEAAQQKGIFVEMVNANNYADDMAQLGIRYVGPDERVSGAAVAQRLLDIVASGGANRGTILAGNPFPTSQTPVNRVEGVKQGAELYNSANGTDFSVTYFEDKAGEDATQAASLYGAQLTRLGEDLVAIAVPGGSVSLPAILQALKDGGRLGTTPVATWDTDSVVVGALERGDISFFKDQGQYYQGYLSVLNAWAHLERLTTPLAINTEAGFVTKDDLSTWTDATKIIDDLAKDA